jgi:hypothetical protein
MFNQLKRIVNKIRSYVSTRWSDPMVIQRMLRAYSVKNTMVTFLIQQDSTFTRMTPHDVLGRIINHEMLIKESKHVKNLSKSITSSRKQDIAFKARR